MSNDNAIYAQSIPTKITPQSKECIKGKPHQPLE